MDQFGQARHLSDIDGLDFIFMHIQLTLHAQLLESYDRFGRVLFAGTWLCQVT